jgi:hypothetical protein
VVIVQLGSLEGALAGREAGLLQAANASSSLWWPGLVRASAVILLALLAFYPLYLLNLAFGGGNRSWRWVAAALFLLLLPVIYEGVAYAGALLAATTGVTALAAPLVLSPFQSPLGGLLWVIVSALAILFASTGLYGICKRFGLLGRAPVRTPKGAEPAPPKVAQERVADQDDDA